MAGSDFVGSCRGIIMAQVGGVKCSSLVERELRSAYANGPGIVNLDIVISPSL